MLDFVIRNVKLPGKAGSFDLGINDGLFVEIVESLGEKGRQEYDQRPFIFSKKTFH